MSTAGPRTVVTGAGGVVGRACTALLAERGHEVITLSRATGGYAPDELAHALAGADHVVHLAAQRPLARPDGADAGPPDFAVNPRLTEQVAAAARRAGAHLVLASSVAVHGPPTGATVTERSPLAPATAYAESKAASEEAAAAGTDAAALSVLRLSHVYGAGEQNGYFVNVAIGAARAGRQITLTGRSPGRRNLVAATDVAAAVLAAVEQRAAGTFLVAGPAGYLNSEIARCAVQVFGAGATVVLDPSFVEEGPDESFDASATLATLRLPPPADLPAGLRRLAGR